MKICAISDLHGRVDLSELKIKADVLCIAGDFIPLYIQRNIQKSIEWINSEFIPWLNKLDVECVLLISGNHDFICSYDTNFKNLFIGTKIHYLEDSSFEYIDDNGNSILFYGTPWCHQFGNWAFMASDEFIKNKYEKIPNNIDILITHDPFSLGTVGTIQKGYYTGEQAGNKVLTDTIIHLENPPKIVFSGHIHTGNHNLDTFSIANKDGKVNTIKFMNVSLLNEDYNHVYDPAYIDYK